MAANQKLADDVWTYEDVSPPNVVDLLSQITDFLTAIGYQKSAKALQKEAKGDGFEIDLKEWSKKVEGGDATGLTQLWHDWKATKGSQEEAADDSSSGSDSDSSSSSSSSDSDSDSDSDSSSDAKGGALVEAKAEVTSDDSSDSDSSSSSEDEKPAAKTGAKRKRSTTPSSSSGSDSSSDEEMAEAGNASDSSSGSSSSDSSSSDSDARPAKKAKTSNKKVAAPSSASSSASDSSSSSSSDSSSSSESGTSPSPKEKAKKQKKTKAKPTPTPVKPEERSASSSATLAGASPEPPKQAVKVEQPASTEDSSSGMHPARLARLDNTGGRFASQAAKVKESNVPFSRIPADQAVDPRFASNEYVPYDYAERAHRDLIVTRGKGFTKEKNKKKRGSYRGGAIDLAPKGIKFQD